MITEAREKELMLYTERERLAKEQHEKDKKNYDDEMEKINSSIQKAQTLAEEHITLLKDEAEKLIKAANVTAAWKIK